jgi:outer membrane receptor protein involved in Fe transport
MKPLRTSVILAMVLLLSLAAWAGTTGKIAGEIKDSQTGELLVGANIQIEGTSMGAATNIDGYFVILNVPPGQYSVSASLVGYTKKKVTGVMVSIDLTTTVNVQLTSSMVETEEVVVTAERRAVKRDLTSAEARVDASQIETLPVQEVSEVLSLQAGITVDRSGGIHIRGGRTSEVAYWVDGVSVSDAYDGGQAVQVDNNAVQELQVISGTFNAEYGQAMSGIVNIVTKDGQSDYHGTVQAYTGAYVTNNGYLFEDRNMAVAQSRPSDGSDITELYYNLNKIRPFNNRNIEGSLSGPVPGLDGLTFYASGRYFHSDGYLWGNRVFLPQPDRFGNQVLAHPLTLLFDGEGNIIGASVEDDPVPMNDRTRYSGQFKLTYQLAGDMKLSVSGLGSKIDYRDYSHDWFITPDGDVRKYDQGYNTAALWTHTLGATSFYTLGVSFFLKDFKEYLYEDPFDARYVSDPNVLNRDLYEYISRGTNNHRFKRRTETAVAKLDYTDQISKLHQLKIGGEMKVHRLYLEDFSLTEDATTGIGPIIPAKDSPLYEEYTETPREFSVYIQDKLEYERMVVNVGLRFDYFDSRGKSPVDPQDPNVFLPQKEVNKALSLDQRMSSWYKNAEPKYSISPRFGISYPITDEGILHFSYGHFLQIPSFIHLYQKPGFKVTQASGIQGTWGNPDLDPQRTIMYEFGLQQQVSDVMMFDVTGFYRDTRDWVTTSVPIPVRDLDTYTSSYLTYVNRDYANSRGVTISLTKRQSDLWSLNLAYTFQAAEGNNSNPDDEAAAYRNNTEPARALTPLDWDQTHTANLTFGLAEEDWGLFILGRYGSGLPYTPTINQAEARGEDAARAVQRNSRRRPENYTIDLRAFKNFTFGPFTASVFLKVFNLLDRRNEVDIYTQTGRATATVQALAAENIDSPGRINSVGTYIVRPEYFSEPREVQFGIELSF